jgi:YegS/Rv2252/BmrU family lipid kinase
MNPLPLVIVNPASRRGEAGRDWPGAAAALRAHFGAFECRFTQAAGHASRIAREEAGRGRSLLLTFGGDGTISETARGILDSGMPAELGILPHGTGGDLARSLAVPARIADAARALRGGAAVAIDVGRVVFSDGTEKSFVNSASFGLSAEVAYRARRGGGSYAVETIRAAFRFEHPEVEISADGGTRQRLHVTTVSLHNGRYFGGGMNMAPEAKITDGRLDVVVVKKIAFSRLARNSPLLYFGAHLGLPEVEHGKLTSLDARPALEDVRVRVEIDGEPDDFLPARFEIRPRALRVRLPRPC